MMRPPSEYIAPFDEDRQTGLAHTVPDGGVVAGRVVVAVGDTVALADAVAVRVGVAVVAVGDFVALEDAVAEWDAEAVAEWVAVLEVGDDGGLVAGAEAVVVLVVGVGVTPSLSTVKAARRMEVAPRDHVRTAIILCGPSASFAVSKGFAEPSLAVPARSKGGATSVRMGVLDFHESSR
jgi:hypothetical protein